MNCRVDGYNYVLIVNDTQQDTTCTEKNTAFWVTLTSDVNLKKPRDQISL
jgi:hypothetical protein